jgi:hypothetical protein
VSIGSSLVVPPNTPISAVTGNAANASNPLTTFYSTPRTGALTNVFVAKTSQMSFELTFPESGGPPQVEPSLQSAETQLLTGSEVGQYAGNNFNGNASDVWFITLSPTYISTTYDCCACAVTCFDRLSCCAIVTAVVQCV